MQPGLSLFDAANLAIFSSRIRWQTFTRLLTEKITELPGAGLIFFNCIVLDRFFLSNGGLEFDRCRDFRTGFLGFSSSTSRPALRIIFIFT
jgi:hypothetical protein